MIRPLAAAALLALAPAAQAGPFDDLSTEDRAALQAEIRTYLLENPSILNEMVGILEAERAAAARAAEAEALATYHGAIFFDEDAYIAGNPDGDITIVEFADYRCGFCKRAHPEMTELLATDSNIRLIKKEFPILGPQSEAAARAAVAVLLEQGDDLYADFSDRLMRHDGDLSQAAIVDLASSAGVDVDAMIIKSGDDEVTQILQRNRDLAQALSISGTPTYIVVDEFIRGYMPLDQLRETVEAKRAEM